MPLHDIEMSEFSNEFAQCWSAAGRHLTVSAQGQIQHWLKAELTPPFLEHLSFRLGNQLFFVRIEDEDQQLEVPGNWSGVQMIAEKCAGHACLMPMQKRGGQWQPAHPGWGLLGMDSGALINPAALVSDEATPMTAWELHDFAVQVVRADLEKAGRHIMSWQSNPHADPSIWFVGDSGPEWVVVRPAVYPDEEAPLPAHIAQIRQSCVRLSLIGHFASVSVVCLGDCLSQEEIPMRGYRLMTNYAGLKKLQ